MASLPSVGRPHPGIGRVQSSSQDLCAMAYLISAPSQGAGPAQGPPKVPKGSGRPSPGGERTGLQGSEVEASG